MNRRRKKSKTFSTGMMVLVFIAAICMTLSSRFEKEEESGLTSSFSDDSKTYETAENSAQVISLDKKKTTESSAESATGTATTVQDAIAAIEQKEQKDLKFRTKDKLDSHYKKHGIEMGFSSEDEYLEAANALIKNPEALHKLQAEDGDDVYYLESTDEIAFVSKDGYIRTYFICSGKAYYDRQ